MGKQAEAVVRDIFSSIDVTINGNLPSDIKVHDNRFYERVLFQGSLGLGESYMDGWWDCDRIDELIFRILRDDLQNKVGGRGLEVVRAFISYIINKQKYSRAFNIGQEHYDLGNDLYGAMLGHRLVYTCGYWKDANNLDEAQEAKLDLVCRKLGLKSGQTVLDIGCGWCSFAKFAAEKYGAKVVGITVSKEQRDLGNEICAGLPVELRLQDYRDVKDKFDHVVSLGMFEHVGPKNYQTYFDVVRRCLNDDGLFLLHTIGTKDKGVDPWSDKYIFPDGVLPRATQITRAARHRFVLEDWHNFGCDYDRTLMAWLENFDQGWDTLKDNYDDRFRRMWRYYLQIYAGSFRARNTQLWQIVFSKRGVPGGLTYLR